MEYLSFPNASKDLESGSRICLARQRTGTLHNLVLDGDESSSSVSGGDR